MAGVWRDHLGRFAEKPSVRFSERRMEATLRGRLLPCQLEDLNKTGTFCVVSLPTQFGGRGNLYRIFTPLFLIKLRDVQLVGYRGYIHDARFIMDGHGQMRNFWFSGMRDDIYGRRRITGWAAVYSAYVLITCSPPMTVENASCHEYSNGR